MAAGVAVAFAAASVHGQQARKVDDATLLKPADGDWVGYGRDYAETHHSPLKQIDQTNVSRLGVAWSIEVGSEGKLETTPLVFNGVLYGTSTWSHGLRDRSPHRQDEVAMGSGSGARRLRRDGAACRAAVRSIAASRSMTARSTSACSTAASSRSTRETGKPVWVGADDAAEHAITRSPARRASIKGKVVIGQGGAEYGVRGFLGAYDAQTGKLAWKFYVVPGDPSKPFEDRSAGARREDVERAVVEVRRRRHAVGRHRLRPGTESGLRRHRQRLAVERAASQSRRRRQPVPVVDRRAQRRHRQVRVALPDDARRQLGLQRRAADDPRRPDDRESAAQGDHAGAEERLLLRARSRQRQADLRRAVRVHVVGDGDRQGDRTSEGNRAGALSLHAGAPVAVTGRRASLAADGVQSGDEARLLPWPGNQSMVVAMEEKFEFNEGQWNLGMHDGHGANSKRRRRPIRRRRRWAGFFVAWDPIANKQAWRIPFQSSGGALSTAGQLIFVGNSARKVLRARSGQRQDAVGIAAAAWRCRDADQLRARWQAVHRGDGGHQRRPRVFVRARCEADDAVSRGGTSSLARSAV